MNKVFLLNNICYEKIRFENTLKGFLIFAEEGTTERWVRYTLGHPLCTYYTNPIMHQIAYNDWQKDIWIHVWDDSPFSGEIFQRKIGMSNPQKNFFVLYRSTSGYSEGFLDALIQSKFGGIYLDVEERNRHVFIVNPDTNEGMDKLAEEVRKEMIC